MGKAVGERITDSLAKIEECGFAVLAKYIRHHVYKLPDDVVARIDAALSIGGFRFIKKDAETERRRLVRATALAVYVYRLGDFDKALRECKDQTDAVLRQKLSAMHSEWEVKRLQGAKRPMQSGIAQGKAYNYFIQQTHADAFTKDPNVARARGWVAQHNDPTTFVPEQGQDSCGPTALTIAYYYLKGMTLPESSIRDMSGEDHEGYHVGGAGSGTGSMYSLSRTAVRLGMIVPPNGCVNARGDLANWLRENVVPTRKRVAIVNVGWHFSVAVDIRLNHVICADPWFGIVSTPISQVPSYSAPGKAFNGWVLALRA